MRIAVIGAGIGGLAAASYLSRAGYSVALFETFPEPRPVGAGLLLQPPGQAVLKDLGIYGDAAAHAVPIARLHSLTTSGKKLLDLSYGHLKGEPRTGLGIQRTALHGALLDAVTATNCAFLFGKAVVGIRRQEESCFIQFEGGDEGPFDLVIVSSGSRSQWLTDKTHGRTAPEYPWGCMWATVPLPVNLDPNTLHQRCLGTRHMVGLLPILTTESGTSAALYWSLKNADAQSWSDKPYRDFLAELGSIWPDAADAAAQVDKQEFVHASYRDVWCKKPYHDRVWLIGDAAHGTSPQLGQGCSMALLDAKAVSEALLVAPTLGDAAEHYMKSRRLQLRYIRWASRLMTPVFQHEGVFYGAARDRLLGPVTGFPGLYGLTLRTLASDLFL